MKPVLYLMLMLALAACGNKGDNTPPPDDGTQVTDAFSVTFTPKKDDFYVAKGTTGAVKIAADITKPEEVSELKISVSSGVSYVTVDPVEGFLLDDGSLDIQVAVSTEAQGKPFMTVTIEGLDARGDTVTEQIRQDFQWTLE